LAPLIAQTLGVGLASCLLYVLAARVGASLDPPRAVAVTVVLVLAVLGVAYFRDGWEALAEQRERTEDLSREAARSTCTQVGVDQHFLNWVAARVPVRERFYMRAHPRLIGQGDICIRFLLLPRLQVSRPEDARYLVFWGRAPEDELAEARRRGAIVETFRRRHLVARVP
jgi:hypothetical protein